MADSHARPRPPDPVSAPPLVWTGVAVTLLSCVAITVALLFAGRAERSSETAESFHRRLELLRIERDLVFAADRLEALALLNLITGSHAGELAAAQDGFDRRVAGTEAALERFLAAGDHGNEAARRLLDAVRAFSRTHAPPGSPAEPVLPPEEMYERMAEYSEQLHGAADRAVEIAAGRIAAEARTERRRRAAAYAVALLVTIAAVVTLLAIELHRRRFNRHLRRLAETDALTGVGNRHSLQAIERPRLADPRQGGFALIQLDVDNFKAINDSFGHHVGDRALIEVAATCRAAVRADDSVARIGGDEFVIVLHGLVEPEAGAREVAHRIHEHLGRPLDCDGHALRVQVSTGIATAAGTADLDELMIEADLALYAAKERGSNHQEVFADPVRRALVRDLPAALANGGVRCVFQPQFDLVTGEVVGLEALARWRGDDAMVVPVSKMIDAVEWLGETLSLLRCVLRGVETAHLEVREVFSGRFWVNLSPADLAIADSASALLDVFGGASVPLERLGVEVTESLPILDFAQASETLERLREAGLAIAIDDFGSQNTPLKHLTRLPVDVVKLDRSVISQIDVDRSNRVLADAVCRICAAHGMTALAEGVESASEIEALREIGVRRAQGFALSRPLGLDPLAEFLGAREPISERYGVRAP